MIFFAEEKTADSSHKLKTYGFSRLNNIKKIYEEGELIQDITCAKFAHMGSDEDQTYITELYNLDVIISVGYRVKSQRGTQFRIWANSVLKDYLIKGYAVRNDLAQQKYDDLKALVDVMGRTMGYLDSPADDQIKSIFDVVKVYTYALDTLDSYDYQTLSIRSTSKECFHATYENARAVIEDLKHKFGKANCSAMRRTDPSTVPLARSIRPGTASTSTLRSRRKRPCCSTSS